MLIVRVMCTNGTGLEFITTKTMAELGLLFFQEDTPWIHIPGETETKDPVMQSVLREQVLSVIIFPRPSGNIAVPSPRLVQ